jgi:hypothetical protein
MKFTIKHSKTPKGHEKNQTTIPFQAQPTTTGYTYTGTMDMGVQRGERQMNDNSNRDSTFHRKAFAIHFKINPKKEHGTTKEATHDHDLMSSKATIGRPSSYSE